jgi:hypothetical protein
MRYHRDNDASTVWWKPEIMKAVTAACLLDGEILS